MGFPTTQDNRFGYENTSILPHVEILRNSSLMIAHGISDDNVHFENSAELIYRLNEIGLYPQIMAFPYKNHGLNGKETRKKLYGDVGKFLNGYFTTKNSDTFLYC
uniref:Prolyl endopeptidase FAP (Trinotate prediction) n=1 Tax=Henneguya salminicola TaxID=69463 RepID=A0A6G3MFA9_HENSL